jgi:GntR family transcriptional regulator
MSHRIDPNSPVPLYHQIAEAVRYDIATGRLKAGETLPPLRSAAEAWGVNLHTVRHAYRLLAERGAVTIKAPHGAVVCARPGAPPKPNAAAVDRFVERVAHDAQTNFGLSAAQLAERLLRGDATRDATPTVHVVECSLSQCEDLARQLEAVWDVRAVPWCLESNEAIPPGDVVATYFHYNDVRQRAPERLARVNFVTIRPDEALAERIGRGGRRGKPRVSLVERDESMARSIAADVSVILAPLGVAPVPVMVTNPADAIAAAKPGETLLFSPRMWGALTDEQRSDGRSVEVRYVIDAAELAALGERLGWNSRRARAAASGVER